MNIHSEKDRQDREMQISDTPPADPLIADPQIDAALQCLNAVQPAARLQQRIHARLAQESSPMNKGFGWAVWSSWQSKLAGIWSWPRAAFAMATFTAGVLAATLGLPLLHHPATGPIATNPVAGHNPVTPTAANQPVPAQSADVNPVHPGFTVRTPDGRAAALNSLGAIATVRSRNAHSDTQLASRKQDHVQARLAKPVRPKAGTAAAPATAPDSQTPGSQPPDTQPSAKPQAPATGNPSATPATGGNQQNPPDNN